MLLTCLVLLLVFGLVNFYFSIQILQKVSSAETKVSFFEIRWQVHKQMRKYCEMTRSKTGRAGSAFYGYWGSLLLMLVCVMQMFASALG